MLLENFDKKYLDECLNIWNEDVGFIFPISKAMFEEKTVGCRYYSNAASFVIKDNDKIIGYVISKVFKDNPNIPKYQNVGWISLIFVKRNERKKGYGNILLTSAEEKMKELGVTTIMVGSDIHNFFPGIPNDFDNTSDTFFANHNYDMGYYTHDLIKKLSSDDLIKYSSYNNNEYLEDGKTKKVLLRYANGDDKDALLEFLKRVFFGRWYDEGIEYFSNGDIKKEYLLALVDDKVVGFLRVNNGLIKETSYNINWQGRFQKLVGFGPLGVDPSYRHHGIAKMLLYHAIADSYKNGYSDAMIDWTGLVTYYQKLGFETWKCFKYAKKKI